MRTQFACVVLAMLALITASNTAAAEQSCCAHCGCAAQCKKVCRLVCEEKDVEITCWGCKCEDFCVACPSKHSCPHCKNVCAECEHCTDPKAPYSEPKKFVWFNWFPSTAKIYTRTKLMRKTVTVTVPSHKWVVEELCPDCCAGCTDAIPAGEVEETADLPIPPPTGK